MRQNTTRGIALTAIALLLGASSAFAQTAEVKAKLDALKPAGYPNQPIEISVGAPAGGGMDITARLFAQTFQQYSGATVVVNNRSGASGLIFNRWIATQAPADGYHLGVANNLMIADSLLRAKGEWSYTDLDNLAFINHEPIVWLTSSTGKFKGDSLTDVLNAAKSDKDSVRVAIMATTFVEMLAEQVERKSSAAFNKIPYNGGAPAVTAVLGDHIDVSFGFVGEFRGHGDKLKPIAVASAKPVDYLPGVPTFNSVLGTDDVNWQIWRYIVAPKGISEDRKTWLVAVLNEVLKDPQLIKELDARGGSMDHSLNTPEKVTAELGRIAQLERKYYIESGRLKE